MSSLHSSGPPAILLFDGVCHSCNFIVDFILRRDKKKQFRFGFLQSRIGHALLEKHELPVDRMDTLVLIEGDQAFTYSTAVFKILFRLGWPWRALAWASFLPQNLTDRLYQGYARNRYRLFGKREVCRILTRDEQDLFLEES
jgi:predicted DCC family thiol-disulfide oxidoreductase YuxK